MLSTRLRHAPGRDGHHDGIEYEAYGEACNDVDGIVGTDIDGGHTHQCQHDADEPRQPPRLGAEGQHQQHNRDADMTAGEGGRGPLAGGVGVNHTLIEPAVLVARHRHHLVVGEEVVADVGEHASGDIVETGGQIVVLRTCDGQQVEDDVEGKEGAYHDQRRALELLIAVQEVIECDGKDEYEVAGVVQVHQLAPYGPGELLAEEQCRLTAEECLLHLGEVVVEVGQYAVQFVGVRIPPRQHGQLQCHATEHRQTAGHQPVDAPQGGHRHQGLETPQEHRAGIGQLRPQEQHHQRRQHGVADDHPLGGYQSALRLLLYSKQFPNHSQPCSLYHLILRRTPSFSFTCG